MALPVQRDERENKRGKERQSERKRETVEAMRETTDYLRVPQ